MVDEPEKPLEVATGAIRMVAFGVLEFEEVPTALFKEDVLGSKGPHSVAKKRNDEILTLLEDEFKALGWALRRATSRRWDRRKEISEHILLGPLFTGGAFVTRPRIGSGTIRDCCLAAVKFLDGPEERDREHIAQIVDQR